MSIYIIYIKNELNGIKSHLPSQLSSGYSIFLLDQSFESNQNTNFNLRLLRDGENADKRQQGLV